VTDPTQVPAELIAGDTWAWTRDLSDYPAGTWDSVWYFEKADQNFKVDGVDSGTTHTATIAAATSAAYRAGRYRWRLTVTRTSDSVRKTIEEGWLEVMADPAAVGNLDHRSSPRIVLDNIEAYLQDPTNLRAASYSLGGRSLSRYSMSELLSLKSQMEIEVHREEAAERVANGLGNPRRLYVRFDRG
jgi:hypothetical protein